MSFTKENQEQLDSLGWTVVPGVVSESDCDRHQAYLQQWLSKFSEWPQAHSTLIQRYKAAHLPPTWEVRLATQPVFAQIWGTSCLLTSMDSIAIGIPPEDTPQTLFKHRVSYRAYRTNQTPEREGLHAYQGQVFLEHCDKDDWTYEVLEGSHLQFDKFMEKYRQYKVTKLEPDQITWFEEQGCPQTKLSCPKGGLLLSDARLFHSSVKPIHSRPHPERWRCVIYVCMTPAAWATESDLEVKRKAYENMLTTVHWPSQKVALFDLHEDAKSPKDPYPEFTLAEVARSDEAKRLAGVLPYTHDNQDPDFWPAWNEDKYGDLIDEYNMSRLTITRAKITKD